MNGEEKVYTTDAESTTQPGSADAEGRAPRGRWRRFKKRRSPEQEGEIKASSEGESAVAGQAQQADASTSAAPREGQYTSYTQRPQRRDYDRPARTERYERHERQQRSPRYAPQAQRSQSEEAFDEMILMGRYRGKGQQGRTDRGRTGGNTRDPFRTSPYVYTGHEEVLQTGEEAYRQEQRSQTRRSNNDGRGHWQRRSSDGGRQPRERREGEKEVEAAHEAAE